MKKEEKSPQVVDKTRYVPKWKVPWGLLLSIWHVESFSQPLDSLCLTLNSLCIH